MTRLTLLMILMASSVVQAATYYAQNSSVDINSASLWNTAANGSGSTLTWANLQADDILCANGKTGININVGFTCAKITTETLDGAGGGGFTISTTLTVNADIVAGSTECLAASNGAGQNVTWNGNVTGGTGAKCYGVNKTNSGAWIGTGNYTGGSATGTSYGLHANGYKSTITIVGNVLNGTSEGIYFLHDCTATTNGTVGATDSTVPSISVAKSTTLTFTGNMIFGYVAPISMVSGAVFYYTPGATNYTDYPTTGPARIRQYNDIPDAANVVPPDTVAGVEGTYDEASRNIDPGEENVQEGVEYKIQNVAKEGAFVVPIESEVKAGTLYGYIEEFTGTYVGGGGDGAQFIFGGIVR